MGTQRRYPGTPPFEQKDANIFFGRDKDIKGLLRLIRLKELVVLYAKSGLGKTSLINAGVIPALNAINQEVAEEMEGISYESMRVRFFAWKDENSQSPLHTLSKETIGQTALNPLFEKANLGIDNLWLSFKNYQLNSSTPATYVLFFDQFEELFTYPEEQIRDLKKALTTLLQARVPTDYKQHLREQFKAYPGVFSKEEKKQLLQPIQLKVVLGIRSDRLSLLHQMSDYLPNVLVNLYELKALNSVQARAAIALPAQQQGDFDSPQFTYSEAALNEILTHLEGEGTYVEPFQIQYICEHAEKVIAQSQKNILEKGDLGDLDELFENYYHLKIAEISPEADRERARNLLEDGLLFNGVRLSLLKEQITSSRGFDISPPLLRQLENVRLVRAEGRGEQIYYEITHDTLVEPIAKAKEERKAKERRRQMLLFGGLGIASFLIVLAGFIAVSNLYYDSRKMASKYLTSEAKKTFEKDDHRLTSHLLTEALDYHEGNVEAQVLLDSVPLYLADIYQNYTQNLEASQFSPNGDYFAFQTNVADKTADLHLMNLQTKELRKFSDVYFAFQYTQDGQYLLYFTNLVKDSTATMHLLDLKTFGEETFSEVYINAGCDQTQAHSLVFYKEVVNHEKGTMYVVNTKTLEEKIFPNQHVGRFKYGQSEQHLLFYTDKTENNSGTFHLLDLAKLKDRTFRHSNIYHENRGLKYDYIPAYQQLVFFTNQNDNPTLHVLNVETLKEKTFPNSEVAFHYINDKYLAFYTNVVDNETGTLHILNVETSKDNFFNRNYHDVEQYEYLSKENRLIFIAKKAFYRDLHILNLSSSEEKTFFEIKNERYQIANQELFCMTEDEDIKKIHIFNMKTMKERLTIDSIFHYDYSSNLQYLAFWTGQQADTTNTVQFLDLSTFKEKTFPELPRQAKHFNFSSDGKYIMFFTDIEDYTGTLHILNRKTLKQQAFPGSSIYAHRFSLNSEKLLFLSGASDESVLHVVDVNSMKKIRSLHHQMDIKDTEFSADGRFLMSCSNYLRTKSGVLKITDLQLKESDLLEYYNDFYAPLTDEEEENYSLD